MKAEVDCRRRLRRESDLHYANCAPEISFGFQSQALLHGACADGDRSGVGVCPRRPAVRWQGPTGGAVLRLARSNARASRAASGRLRRHSTGPCVRRSQPTLSSQPQTRSIVEALCWSNARRKFFELADIAANARRSKTATPISPIAFEAVRRIDALFDIELRSTACRPPVAWPCARRGAPRWSPRSKAGCAPSAPNSPSTMQSPRRSTTCSLSAVSAFETVGGFRVGRISGSS
jgi:hypothetical protein